MKSLKAALVLIIALAASLPAQMASVSAWHTGPAPYVGSKDTVSDSYGFYSSVLNYRMFWQVRRGLDGRNVSGIFMGRNLVDDYYHKNLLVFISGGVLSGNRQNGPALELIITKQTINELYTAEFRSQYAWGIYGSQNLARNSFIGFLKLDEILYAGISAEALYRPRSSAITFERADAGPAVRMLFGQVFFQGSHYWDMTHPKAQKFSLSAGISY